jgi:hypothetical protein
VITVTNATVKAMGVLPAGTMIHFQDRYDRREWTGDPTTEADFLQQASDDTFSRTVYPANTCYVFITMRARNVRGGRRRTTATRHC